MLQGDAIFRPDYLVMSKRDSWDSNVVKRGRWFHDRNKIYSGYQEIVTGIYQTRIIGAEKRCQQF